MIHSIIAALLLLTAPAVAQTICTPGCMVPLKSSTVPAAAPTTGLSGWLLGGPNTFGTSGPEQSVFKMHPDGTGKVNLTSPGWSPSWSFDGTRIVYSCPGPVGMQLCTMAADGTNKAGVAVAGLSPAYTPDGKRIVYQMLMDPAEVGIVNIDGTGKKQLTFTTGIATSRHGAKIQGSGSPNVSPDGKTILYTSSQDGHNQIWMMALDGSGQKAITTTADPKAPDANAASWSPDGTQIVVFRGYETEYGNVEVMPAAGDATGRRKLSGCKDTGDRPANCDSPAWSADGKWIIFSSDMKTDGSGLRDPSNAIRTWIVPADGSAAARVLTDPAINRGSRAWTK